MYWRGINADHAVEGAATYRVVFELGRLDAGFQVADDRTVAYNYDRLHRVTRADYDVPADVSTIFNYDLLGNRQSVYDVLNDVTYSYAHNKVNEYTKLSIGLSPTDDYYYDVRGNLSRDDGFDDDSDDAFVYGYDPENRLTQVDYDPGGGSLTTVAEYRYDGRGRRIEFINSPPDGVTTTLRYVYDGQSMVGEYLYDSSAMTLTRTYVNGPLYIDERAVMRDHDDSGQDYYYLLQELYTVAGLAKCNGNLAEMYTYDTYGNATVYDWPYTDARIDSVINIGDRIDIQNAGGTFNPICDVRIDGAVNAGDRVDCRNNQGAGAEATTSSALGNPFLFTGRITDTLHADALLVSEDANYRRHQDNRNRIYDLKHSRWLQRDPLGVRPDAPQGSVTPQQQYMDGMNLYVYVRNSPLNSFDPLGLVSPPAHCECKKELWGLYWLTCLGPRKGYCSDTASGGALHPGSLCFREIVGPNCGPSKHICCSCHKITGAMSCTQHTDPHGPATGKNEFGECDYSCWCIAKHLWYDVLW